MKFKQYLMTAIVCLCAVPVAAQTVIEGPLTITHRFAWEQSWIECVDVVPKQECEGVAMTPARAQTWIPRFYVDKATAPLPLTGMICVPSVPPVVSQYTCTASLTPALVTILNVAGTHSVDMRIYDPASAREVAATALYVWVSKPDLPTIPSAPSGVRIIR